MDYLISVNKENKTLDYHKNGENLSCKVRIESDYTGYYAGFRALSGNDFLGNGFIFEFIEDYKYDFQKKTIGYTENSGIFTYCRNEQDVWKLIEEVVQKSKWNFAKNEI